VPEELRKIKDRFRIDSLIAYGGMARVYKGTDLTLARTVAVKVLSDDLSKDPSFLLRFRREAQAAASLTHPNIVAVYDTGAEAGLHYIVMEYVEGRTLQEILEAEGPLSPDRAAAIGADIGRALAAAHEKGIVHRDVKPGNIMVSDSGFVKVMDFGIAKAATSGSLTQVGAVLGTVAFLSPEQARGEEVDARSDIYSLGSLVYQMLTGRPPFVAETLLEMVNKLTNQRPTPPSRLNPKVPAALGEVVMKALAKDPARRQQDANQLAEQLLQSLRGDPAATAAYAAVSEGEPSAPAEYVMFAEPGEPVKAPVAPAAGADRTMVAPAQVTDETEVIPPTERERGPGVPRAVVVGGIIVVALLLLITIAFSSLRNPLVPLTDPSPTPSARFQPGVGVVTPKTTRPAAPTTTVPAPPTEPTTVPEPPTEPPPEETTPVQEQPTEPPGDPGATAPQVTP
jgi:predicted Ser/Thr protein kinase